MKTILIVYKLDEGVEYSVIAKQIRSYSNWAKVMERVWMIKTTKTTAIVRDEIRGTIDGKGKVLVIDISSQGWGSYNLPKEVTTWMKENM